jgi:ADP-ribose pyrophosphatase YjhB (NUDIX family)
VKTLTNPPVLEHLGKSQGFGPVTLQFEPRVEPPADELVSNVHLVPFVGDRCVVIEVDWRGAGHSPFAMPGGTLEPGETWRDAAHRELIEEAGARVLSITPFAVLRGHTTEATPYRAHLPHPDFFWILGWAEVELVGAPLNPADGERVVDVICTDVVAATRLFESCGEHAAADTYRLAAYLRTNACEQPPLART